MIDLKVYGINLTALVATSIQDINPGLQTLVLISTLIYTVIQIKQKLNDK